MISMMQRIVQWTKLPRTGASRRQKQGVTPVAALEQRVLLDGQLINYPTPLLLTPNGGFTDPGLTEPFIPPLVLPPPITIPVLPPLQVVPLGGGFTDPGITPPFLPFPTLQPPPQRPLMDPNNMGDFPPFYPPSQNLNLQPPPTRPNPLLPREGDLRGGGLPGLEGEGLFYWDAITG